MHLYENSRCGDTEAKGIYSGFAVIKHLQLLPLLEQILAEVKGKRVSFNHIYSVCKPFKFNLYFL